MRIIFDNTYAKLPADFYQQVNPTAVNNPALICWNSKLAERLGILANPQEAQVAEFLSGNKILPGAKPIALAYAGHQFAHFVPLLGDGRAILLGEILDRQGQRNDLQLKGSGPTRFSRRGDGRAALGPVLREYLVSEAMAALKIPTTRSLAAILTGEEVIRETELRGAILLRTAASHIRIGTFEYFFARKDLANLKVLADYSIERHYPQCRQAPDPYKLFLQKVVESQALLIAGWMSVGFIHGVMNTDNMTISGETIDFGPCAFMDSFELYKVYSFIDRQGRYAYGNQPKIAIWNLQSFANCLAPLMLKESLPADGLDNFVAEIFTEEFNYQWQKIIAQKLGLEDYTESDSDLINDLFGLLQQYSLDFTLCFRYLSRLAAGTLLPQNLYQPFLDNPQFSLWVSRWQLRLAAEHSIPAEISKKMLLANPAVIPRNHKIEEVIKAAEELDFKPFNSLLDVLLAPFDSAPETSDYAKPPRKDQEVPNTFCGT